MGLFTRKNREEKIDAHVESILSVMITGCDTVELTELELVQIANRVRSRLADILVDRRAANYSKSVDYQQKGNEIKEALALLV